jgi:hypothetical protein
VTREESRAALEMMERRNGRTGVVGDKSASPLETQCIF